ncbi:MAG: SO_0444 family Cu/Zn efflux transporter, partial [Methanosarcinaceae archaeon]
MSLQDTVIVVILGITAETWYLFEEAAPYLFLGFGMAALLDMVVPESKIISHLGSSAGKFRSVFKASLAGVPMPLCSCGVIPTAMSLKKRGASNGATVSFLISTPETGLDSIAITYALLDPIMTVFRPVAAFITAIGAGVANNLLIREEKLQPSLQPITLSSAPHEHDISPDCLCCGEKGSEKTGTMQQIVSALKYAYVELLGDISKWLVIGLVLAGVISYAIPDEFIRTYLGGGAVSMFLMLLIGIPMYICATASTPLAAALIAKGMSPGTAFVFLLAGPATNTATITVVAKFLGKQVAVVY